VESPGGRKILILIISHSERSRGIQPKAQNNKSGGKEKRRFIVKKRVLYHKKAKKRVKTAIWRILSKKTVKIYNKTVDKKKIM